MSISLGASANPLLIDPAWLPHRLLGAGNVVRMVHAPRPVHQGATFLDDEGVKGRDVRDLPIAVLHAVPPAEPIGFVFHSAFCCSTLLARSLDLPGISMGLKEPAILNDLAALSRAGRTVDALLAPVLALLSRPLEDGERIVIKPSNVANILIEPLLRASPQSRAILMYAPLRDFLVSVAKKGLWGRIWMRRLYAILKGTPDFDPGFDANDLFIQTDLQIAALAWLQHQQQFAQLLQRHAPGLRSLQSPTLLARPDEAIAAVASHFGLLTDVTELGGRLAPDLFTGHSKRLGERYDVRQRQKEADATEAAHREEIDMVVTWAVAIARQFRIPLDLDRPVLDPA